MCLIPSRKKFNLDVVIDAVWHRLCRNPTLRLVPSLQSNVDLVVAVRTFKEGRSEILVVSELVMLQSGVFWLPIYIKAEGNVFERNKRSSSPQFVDLLTKTPNIQVLGF